MKHIAFLLLIISTITACSKDDEQLTTELVGTWQLVAVLVDPGDGSGTFKTVDSNKIITFTGNGSITSNGNLCNFSINTQTPTEGMYSTSTNTFTSNACDNSNYNYRFEKNKNTLLIYYPCIEPCQAKFVKI